MCPKGKFSEIRLQILLIIIFYDVILTALFLIISTKLASYMIIITS